MRKFLSFLILSVLVTATVLGAQTGTMRLKGKVLDSTSLPMAATTVKVYQGNAEPKEGATVFKEGVTDNNGDSNNIAATNLMLSALQGVGTAGDALEVSVKALEATGGSGGVNVGNGTSGLVLGGVTSNSSGVSATGGDITIATQGGLTVNEAVTQSGGGNVHLTTVDSTGAGDDVSVNANVTLGAP